MSSSPCGGGGAGINDSGGGGAHGEDDNLGSSLEAFQSMPNDFNSALDDFRTNWQKELQQKQAPEDELQHVAVAASKEAEDVESPLTATHIGGDQEALAKSYFHKAVELEKRGKVYDAIPFYRKAVQIDPNIEFTYYEHQKSTNTLQSKELRTNTASTQKANEIPDFSEEDVIDDLYEKFQNDLARNFQGKLIMSSRDPGTITTEMHISELPPELLLYIMRWVVSNQLDLRSLEHCAAVCKGMYLMARDEEIWRLACVKVWGHNVGSLTHSDHDEEKPSQLDDQCPIIPKYSSWRQMFIERERVLFNGCYISKTTYIRMGENSFQDQYYRPVQLVEYYRYLRFLPDGTVFMMTNADEPQQGVTRLKNLQQLRPDIIKGHYRLFGSTITVVLAKQQQQSKFIRNPAGGTYNRHRRGSSVYDEASCNSTKYCIEFRILHTSKRKFAQLAWLHYSIVQVRNKIETTSEFDITPSKYPPLRFSPVRSYHLDSDAPLI
ncbi:F-box only protein 9 [Stomoxys calcitrans]|uniref:F-box only protein 9 n=1 Tax=Stomoxys calcitrans TaxID=35570 RepID=UPI0027E347E9|nr:F-box only protein 9 [Stomoxys calcitrans]